MDDQCVSKVTYDKKRMEIFLESGMLYQDEDEMYTDRTEITDSANINTYRTEETIETGCSKDDKSALSEVDIENNRDIMIKEAKKVLKKTLMNVNVTKPCAKKRIKFDMPATKYICDNGTACL